VYEEITRQSNGPISLILVRFNMNLVRTCYEIKNAIELCHNFSGDIAG
jgi:hypothetical protein